MATAASDDDEITKSSDMVYEKPKIKWTEKCPSHSQKFVSYYCKSHEDVCCSVCVRMEHRDCNYAYIPDLCDGLNQSQELKDTFKEAKECIADTNLLKKQANDAENDVTLSQETAIKNIEKHQTILNNIIEGLKKKIVTDIEEKTSLVRENIKSVSSLCTNFTDELSHLLTETQGTDEANAFIKMKQVQKKLKEFDTTCTRRALNKVSWFQVFEPNDNLEEILSNTDSFGKLVLKNSTARPLAVITPVFNVNVSVESNRLPCNITGCAFLSPDKAVMVDNNNQKVLIVDMQQQNVIKHKTLDSEPWDIAVLPTQKVAITLPIKKQIVMLNTADRQSMIEKILFYTYLIPRNMDAVLSMTNTVSLHRQCRGIAVQDKKMYVVCWEPDSVLVLDLQGHITCDISLKATSPGAFNSPNYIVVNQNLQRLYVSNSGSDRIVSVTLEGKHEVVFTHPWLKGPFGLAMKEDGSLLVSCLNSDSILSVTADLKYGFKYVQKVSGAHSVCYLPERQLVLVGCWRNDSVRVFSCE